MAKRTSTSSRSNRSRTRGGKARTGGGGRSSAAAGRKSSAGGRGSTRTAGGRTRTGGGTTRAAGGTKSRGGARRTAGRSTAASRSRKRTGTKRTGASRTRATRRLATAQTTRPAGQMSEREKQQLANEFRETGDQKNFNENEELYQRTSDYRQQKRMEEDVFAPTIQKAHLWLKEVMDEIGTQDQHRAYTALKSVLQTLRDRLTVEEAVDLASQLPTLIRGVFFEGWRPSEKPIKYNKEEFVLAVGGYFQNLSGVNHADIVRAVFTILQRHIAAGEINHVIGTMPEEFAEFWMQEEILSR